MARRDKINRILQDFRNQGWSVKVLTSRGLDMKEATKKHLEDSKLDLSIEDVIFKQLRPDGSGHLFEKDGSLITWMETQPQWKTSKNIHILFADDSEKYCREVSRVTDLVKKATVTCFRYIRALPNPKLSDAQMEQLVIQLYAHKTNQPTQDLDNALKGLEIEKIDAPSLYETIRKIAEIDGFPFRDC